MAANLCPQYVCSYLSVIVCYDCCLPNTVIMNGFLFGRFFVILCITNIAPNGFFLMYCSCPPELVFTPHVKNFGRGEDLVNVTCFETVVGGMQWHATC